MADRQAEQYVDQTTGLSRVRGNVALYARMLGMFLESKEMAQLQESYQNKDIQAMADLSHAIKGMTGNLALPALFEISTKLNDELKQGELNEETFAQYNEILEATIHEAQNVQQQLQ